MNESAPSAADATDPVPTSRYKWAVVLVVGSGVFIATLDASGVAVTLP